MRVLLTGGRGGIGSSIKDELVSKGCSVVAPNSDELDLSSQFHVLKWIEANSDLEFDGLVLCAGTNSPRDFDEVETTEYLRILETNLNSNRFLIKAVLPAMQKNKYGRIIAISSSYSTITRSGRSSYSVSKAALEALIRSVSLENAQNNLIQTGLASNGGRSIGLRHSSRRGYPRDFGFFAMQRETGSCPMCGRKQQGPLVL